MNTAKYEYIPQYQYIAKQREISIGMAQILEERRQERQLKRRMALIDRITILIAIVCFLLNIVNQTGKLAGWW